VTNLSEVENSILIINGFPLVSDRDSLILALNIIRDGVADVDSGTQVVKVTIYNRFPSPFVSSYLFRFSFYLTGL
jgi:hypothetical protein